MQKVTTILLSALIVIISASFLNSTKDKVQWLTVAEMQAAYSKNPRPILVDVYTSWCGWCKVMDKETYRKDNVANYINEHYYAVKLDAESKESFEWNGKQYNYDKENKSNELAQMLLYGQLSFPTTVMLPSLDARPAPLPGYLKPNEIEAPLKFFAEGAYKTKSFPEFNQGFKGSW